MELDKDLASQQEARNLITQANKAAGELAKMSQCQIDKIVAAISEAGQKNARRLAQMAADETGFGRAEDKVLKNTFAAKTVYEAIKDMKTVGVLRDDKEHKILDIGVAVGTICGLVPSTNPTSTVIYKALIALKGASPIVFSPHPGAKESILETVRVISEAAQNAGMPEGGISCVSIPTMAATDFLMKNSRLILATGGGAMVKAAYSSGTPAIGVGAGNGPAFIDKSANIKQAVAHIMDSKTFDNGTICASEQSIIVEKSIESAVLSELSLQGGYLLNEEQARKLEKVIMKPTGTMNPQIVGKTVKQIADLAGLSGIPDGTRLLLARESRVGDSVPYSKEKLGPILAFYVEDSVDDVLKKCIAILEFEGSGHTFAMHAENPELVKRFALAMPASRILINTPASLGGIGATTDLFPALTLGCGAVGGSSSSNNIGPLDLINIKRVAYGTRELSDLKCSGTAAGGEACINSEFLDILVKKIVEQLV